MWDKLDRGAVSGRKNHLLQGVNRLFAIALGQMVGLFASLENRVGRLLPIGLLGKCKGTRHVGKNGPCEIVGRGGGHGAGCWRGGPRGRTTSADCQLQVRFPRCFGLWSYLCERPGSGPPRPGARAPAGDTAHSPGDRSGTGTRSARLAASAAAFAAGERRSRWRRRQQSADHHWRFRRLGRRLWRRLLRWVFRR